MEGDREGTQTQNSCYLTQGSDNHSPPCLAVIFQKEPPLCIPIICLNFLGTAVFEIGVPLFLPVSSLTTMYKCVADGIKSLAYIPLEFTIALHADPVIPKYKHL